MAFETTGLFSGYANYATPSWIPNGGPFTFYLWFKSTTAGVAEGILSIGGDSANRLDITNDASGDIVDITTMAGNGKTAILTDANSLGTWYGVAVTLGADGETMTIRLKTGEAGSIVKYGPTDQGSTFDSWGELRIACWGQNTGGNHAGVISNAMVFDADHDDAAVAAQLAQLLPIGTPLAYWPLVSDLLDVSGAARDLTAQGTTAFQADEPDLPDEVSTDINPAVRFIHHNNFLGHRQGRRFPRRIRR